MAAGMSCCPGAGLMEGRRPPALPLTSHPRAQGRSLTPPGQLLPGEQDGVHPHLTGLLGWVGQGDSPKVPHSVPRSQKDLETRW